jgi:hypothetical protein
MRKKNNMKPITQFIYFNTNTELVDFQKQNPNIEIINVSDASHSRRSARILVTYYEIGKEC